MFCFTNEQANERMGGWEERKEGRKKAKKTNVANDRTMIGWGERESVARAHYIYYLKKKKKEQQQKQQPPAHAPAQVMKGGKKNEEVLLPAAVEAVPLRSHVHSSV